MARGPYTETTTVAVLRRLVDFVESDTPVPDLPRDWWKGTRTGRHPLDWMLTGDGLLRHPPLGELRAMRPAEVETLRLEMRAFLRLLAGDKHGGVGASIQVELTPIRVGDGAIKWLVNGPTRDVLLYQLKTLLDRLGGLDRLRLCPAPDCGRVYLKIGRRENCSTRCQQRLYQRDYDPFAAQARRADRPRPTKTTKGRR